MAIVLISVFVSEDARASGTSASTKLGPASKREALANRLDEVYTFIVRGDRGGLDAAKDIANSAGTPIEAISAIALKMKTSDALKLAARQDIEQVWYVHEDLAASYVRIMKGIEYVLKTVPPPSIINLSLGPPAEVFPLPGEMDEPMNVLTGAAAEKGFLTVVAIGNYFDGSNPGMVNPWCLPDWIVCVGAADPSAKKLWEGSARGDPKSPKTWPDVVANGLDVISSWPGNLPKSDQRRQRDEGNPIFTKSIPREKWDAYSIDSGTSEAVPQVVRAANQIMFFVKSYLESLPDPQTNQRLFALEVPADRISHAMRSKRLDGDVVKQQDGSYEVTYHYVMPWKLVKQLLIDTAVPMAEYGAHEQGAGFVSPSYIEEQFGKFGKPSTKLLPLKAID